MHGLSELLAERDFKLLLVGQFIAQAADGIAQAAFAYQILLEPFEQPEPSHILALFATTLVPYSLISPWLGVLVDRVQRRGLLVWTNIARGVTLVTLPLWAGALTGDTPLFVAILVLLGFGRLFLTTKGALLPVVLHEHYLLRGNSVSGGGGMISALAGGALGALLIGLTDPGPSFVIAGVVYLTAAAIVRRISQPFGHESVVERVGAAVARIGRELIGGLKVIWVRDHARLPLAAIFLLRTVGMFVAIAAILIIKERFPDADDKLGSLSISGMALTAAGAGAFMAAVTAPSLGRRYTNAGLIVLGFIISGIAMTVLGGVLGLGILLALLFAGGYGGFVTKVSVDAQVQEAVPDEYRGRAFALYDILYNLASVAAAALMLAFEAFALGSVVVGVGIGTLLIGAALAGAMRRAAMFAGAPGVEVPVDR